MFTYTASVTIRPKALRPGIKAEGAVRFANVRGGSIDKVYASYPGAGRVRLPRQGENTYGMAATIPRRVRPGSYTGYVSARSTTGERGPRIPVRLTVSV